MSQPQHANLQYRNASGAVWPVCPNQPTDATDGWYTCFTDAVNRLDVCAVCYPVIVGESRFAAHFRPLVKSADTIYKCDFSDDWIRVAWKGCADSKEAAQPAFESFRAFMSTYWKTPACSGAVPTHAQWHTIIDPNTHRGIGGLSMCQRCRDCTVALYSKLELARGIGAFPHPDTRACTYFGGDSQRGVEFLAPLKALFAHGIPSQGEWEAYATVVKQKLATPRCRRDAAVTGPCYAMPHIPSLRVCPECFQAVIRPCLERTPPSSLASKFDPEPQGADGGGGGAWACDLYTPRMRAVWQEADLNDDLPYLRAKCREREQFQERTVLGLQKLDMEIQILSVRAQAGLLGAGHAQRMAI